jgi:hypothetical protein
VKDGLEGPVVPEVGDCSEGDDGNGSDIDEVVVVDDDDCASTLVTEAVGNPLFFFLPTLVLRSCFTTSLLLDTGRFGVVVGVVRVDVVVRTVYA